LCAMVYNILQKFVENNNNVKNSSELDQWLARRTILARDLFMKTIFAEKILKWLQKSKIVM
jgi:hypothetical protein